MGPVVGSTLFMQLTVDKYVTVESENSAQRFVPHSKSYRLAAAQRGELVPRESGHHGLPLHAERPLDQVRVLRHQLQRLLAVGRISLHVKLPVQHVAGIDEAKVISIPDQGIQIGDGQALAEIDQVQLGAALGQETPSLPAAGSTWLVIEAHAGHVGNCIALP